MRTYCEIQDKVKENDITVWQLGSCGICGEEWHVQFNSDSAPCLIRCRCVQPAHRIMQLTWNTVENLYLSEYTKEERRYKQDLESFFGFQEKPEDWNLITLKEGESLKVYTNTESLSKERSMSPSDWMNVRDSKGLHIGYVQQNYYKPVQVIRELDLKPSQEIKEGDLYLNSVNLSKGLRVATKETLKKVRFANSMGYNQCFYRKVEFQKD